MTILGSLLGAAMGLILGTYVPPNRISVTLTLVLTPLIFTGSSQYPWPSLSNLRWFQVVSALNPDDLRERGAAGADGTERAPHPDVDLLRRGGRLPGGPHRRRDGRLHPARPRLTDRTAPHRPERAEPDGPAFMTVPRGFRPASATRTAITTLTTLRPWTGSSGDCSTPRLDEARGGVAPLRRCRPGCRPPARHLSGEHGDHRPGRPAGGLSRRGHRVGRRRRVRSRRRRGRRSGNGRTGPPWPRWAPSRCGSTSPTTSTWPRRTDPRPPTWPRPSWRPSIGRGPSAVFLPMGLAHPDHVLTHDAGLLVRDRLRPATVGTAPGRVVLLRGRRLQAPPRHVGLAGLHAVPSGTWPTPAVVPSRPDMEAKRAAIAATPARSARCERDHLLSERLAANVPEQYWRLSARPRAARA